MIRNILLLINFLEFYTGKTDKFLYVMNRGYEPLL